MTPVLLGTVEIYVDGPTTIIITNQSPEPVREILLTNVGPSAVRYRWGEPGNSFTREIRAVPVGASDIRLRTISARGGETQDTYDRRVDLMIDRTDAD